MVAAAVIEREGYLLIARRKRGKKHAGNWEFPGGTVEEGETHEQCLKRELREELAVTAEIGDIVCTGEDRLGPGWTIRLTAYRATIVSGEVSLNDHDEIRWVKPEELQLYDFLDVARGVIEALSAG